MATRHLYAAIAAAAFSVFASTGPTWADDCTASKLAMAGKLESALLSCQAKAASTGDSSKLSDCRNKAIEKSAAAFAKAGACAGALAVCQDTATACETAVSDAIVDALPSKCTAAKRKAAGKYASAALRCHSTAAKKELAVDSECLAKAQGKLTSALAKAGVCTDGGTVQDLVDSDCVEPAVTVDVADMVTGACPLPPSGSTTTTTTISTTSSTLEVDECAAGTDNCDANASCLDTPGSFSCTCLSGFSGDGVTCDDIDECAVANGGCHAMVTCTNIPGSRTCGPCPIGYTGDGITCTDIDECATANGGCHANATCTNSEGGYDCTCNLGYSGDGFSCTALFCIPNVTTRSCYTGAGGTAGVGICQAGLQTCNATGTGFLSACVGEVVPQSEIECDGIDQDCNGSDSCPANGSSQARAGASCKTILSVAPSSVDGVYWIDPNGGATSDAFQANCDMTTDGGGWTELANFTSTTIAITASTYSSGLGTVASSDRALACTSLTGLDLTGITMRHAMGTVRDYFRPTVGNDLCAMLGSFTKHRWSSSANGTFVAPAYSTGNLGGSSFNWPLGNAPGDSRAFLGFWGAAPNLGGCCHTTSSPADGAAWGRAFRLHVREP